MWLIVVPSIPKITTPLTAHIPFKKDCGRLKREFEHHFPFKNTL